MLLSFVSILSSDKLELPGLLFTPVQKTKKAAIWLHGMGDSGVFYKPEEINTLAKAITDKSIAFLAFNNRGAHNRKSITIADETLPEEDRVFRGGTHFELLAECVWDINGAVSYLKEKGFSELYLIGHSTGANKICAYHAGVKSSPFKKYVLSGPGDDSGLFYSELGKKKFKLALLYADKAIKQGHPHKIMPKYTGMYPFSAQAAEDIMNPDGNYNTFPYFEAITKRLGTKPLFKEYQTIDKPLLVVFGDEDEYAYTAGGSRAALNLLMKYIDKSIISKCKFITIPGADHSFHGHQAEFAQTIANWLYGD